MNSSQGRRPTDVLRAVRARALPAILILGCFLAGGGVALATGGFQERQGGYPCGSGSYPGGCSTGTNPCGTGSYPVGCPTQTGTTSTSTTQTQTTQTTQTQTQTTTTTTPKPPLPPAAVLLAKFTLGSSKVRMSPKGFVVLGKVSCPVLAVSCPPVGAALTTTASGVRASRTTTIGKTTIKLKPGQTKSIRIKLTKRAIRVVKRRRSLRTRLTVTRGPGKKSVRNVTIKAPRKT
jgi:hypothetical protein